MDEIARRIVIRRAARSELDAAGDWYEQRRRGMGPRFLAAVMRVLDRIRHQPDFYPIEEQGVREATVTGFPYSILYREDADQIVIFAIFHASRDPAVWKARLD